MLENQDIDQLNRDVFLLAIYKKDESESLNDVIKKMEESRVFSYKEGKSYLKELKKEQYIIDTALSFKGIERAKQIELQFKL